MSRPAGLPLFPPPHGWADVQPAMGEAVGRTSIVLSKTPISERMWKIKNEPEQTFSPAQMVAQQRAQGRAVKYVVQVSTRPINKIAVAQAAAAAAAAAASGSPPPPPMLLGSGDVSDRSDFYNPSADLPVVCQFVHVVVDLDPSAFDPAQKLLDPRQRACPVTASSIKRFVGIMRGIMEGIENEAAKKPPAAASSSAAAAAASSSSAAAASSPALPPCVILHDLYGFNLCGFLLVSFLVEFYQLDVFSALNDVADSRPPGIFAPDLFQALVNRYYEPDEEAKAGAAEAARLSGAPGNKEVERLTCLPVMPELPEPDFSELPWFWSGLAAPAPIITVAPLDDSSTSAAAAAPAAEEPKRKIRKKPVPALPPAAAAAASSSSAAAMTPAAASDAAWSAAAAAMSAASSAPKQPFAGFAPPAAAALPAAKKARVDGPQYSAPVAPAPSFAPAAAAAAATSNRSRSPQPLFHVPAPAPPPAAAAAAASSSSSAVAPDFSASTLSQLIQRDHPFLQLVRADKVPVLQAVLAQMMPAASIAKYKAGGSGSDLNALLRPPPLNLDTIRALHSGPASARAPYLLSWLPAHYACFVLVLRESVYLVFDHSLFFLVPHLSFPKRKAPADRINNTLLLAELIQDRVEGGPVQSRVLVTDLLVMSQTLLLPMMGLEQRLATLDTELMQPLKLSSPSPPSPLHVRAKLMFPLAKLESVLHMAVPHAHLGIELRMSGKDKDAAKSRGFQFVWKKDNAAGVAVAELMALAGTAKK